MITNGSVEISRTRKPGDYESRGVKVAFSFSVEDGENAAVVAEEVARLAHNQVYQALGWSEHPSQITAPMAGSGDGLLESHVEVAAHVAEGTVGKPARRQRSASAPLPASDPGAIEEPGSTSASAASPGEFDAPAEPSKFAGQKGVEALGVLCAEAKKRLGGTEKIRDLIEKFAGKDDPRLSKIPEAMREAFTRKLDELS